MEKKKVLIVSHFMEIGGAERALLGLLSGFDYEKYDVSLFLFRHEGELLPLIPQQVRLLPEIPSYTALACPVMEVVKKGQILLAASRVIGKVSAKIYNRLHRYSSDSQVEIEYSHKYTKWLMQKITPEVTYDLAISFLTPHYFVAEKVSARKKIAWIHTDYSYIEIDVKSEEKMWGSYDNIVAISESCGQSFARRFPGLQEKLLQIENLLAVDFLKEQAKETISEPFGNEKRIILLSVGRFSNAKNFDNIPEICRKILEKGIPVVWYLIGFGTDEALIQSKIQENEMEEHVILLGKKENPYPYLAGCDWYIQPSRYEGKAVTVREAQALHKPVIITDYPTAKSQLTDGYDGVIVPMDNDSCANAIAEILENVELKNRLIRNTYKVDYSNRDEMQKLYALMGESHDT
ncbi:MAG: glycosyltransferase [Fusicatenibacter sp.]|nr:glycosyltransferase [Lachnospiraceae bacterium]MDY2938250.1 glycosyltransferase [Fusicatenibacter sp.]